MLQFQVIFCYSSGSRQIGLTFRNTLYFYLSFFCLVYIGTVIQNRLFKAFAFGLLFAAFLMPLSDCGIRSFQSVYFWRLHPMVGWFYIAIEHTPISYGQAMGQSSALAQSRLVFSHLLRLTNNNFNFLTSLMILSVLYAFCCALIYLAEKLGPVAELFLYQRNFLSGRASGRIYD